MGHIVLASVGFGIGIVLSFVVVTGMTPETTQEIPDWGPILFSGLTTTFGEVVDITENKLTLNPVSRADLPSNSPVTYSLAEEFTLLTTSDSRDTNGVVSYRQLEESSFEISEIVGHDALLITAANNEGTLLVTHIVIFEGTL